MTEFNKSLPPPGEIKNNSRLHIDEAIAAEFNKEAGTISVNIKNFPVDGNEFQSVIDFFLMVKASYKPKKELVLTCDCPDECTCTPGCGHA